MKKSKLLSLFMGSLMIGSCLLSSCSTAEAGNSVNNTQKNDIPQNSGNILEEDPVQTTVTGNQPSEFFSQDSADVNAMATSYYKEREEQALAAQGIGKEDYIWTIVTLKGENLIDRYREGNVTESISEYVVGAGKTYKDQLLAEQDNIKRQIYNYDPDTEFSYSYTLASNGFAAKVKYGNLEKLRAINGVESISVSERYESPELSDTTFYSSDESGAISAEDTSGEERPGEGTFIAVVDSALDNTHPAFSGDCIDMSKAKVDKERISSIMYSTDAYYWNYTYNYSSGNANLDVDSFYYNNKLVFKYDYGNKDSGVSPYIYFADTLSHGTHTAGIAVGNDESTGFKGVSPYAQFAFMKVFYEDYIDGVVYSEDIYIAAAIEDCIMLGVDAINLSLGAARGFSVDNTSENYIYQYCYYADLVGINVEASVGNGFNAAYAGVNGDYPLAENPDYGAVNSPASFASTLAIGSYDGYNAGQYYALIDNETKLYYTDNTNEKFIDTLGAGTYNWVYVDGDGTYTDFINAGVSGKIAFVRQNSTVSVDGQMVNAIRSGAKAIVYVDSAYYSYVTVTSSVLNTIPYCSMPLVEAEKILDKGSGTFTVSYDQVAYNLMSVYSAWGPTNSLTLKPEIVTIGGNVYSSVLSGDYFGDSAIYHEHDYTYMSGTSMAAPKATAYVARLKKALRERYPEKSNVEIAKLVNQLVMSTATQLSDLNGITYSPRYQGAGALNYEAALYTPAYISVMGSNKTKIELGEDEAKTGVYVLNFNVNNMSDQAHTYAMSVEAMTQSLCGDGKTVSLVAYILEHCTTDVVVSGAGASLNKTNNNLTVAAGASASVAITLRLSDADKKYIDDNFSCGSYVEGYVTLAGTNGEYDLSIPFLAFYGDWEKSALMDKSIYDGEDATIFASELVGLYNYGQTAIKLGEYPYYDPEGNFTMYINEQESSGEVLEYDGNRIAIGSKSGGYYSLYQMYVGLMRNADTVEFFISNAETGELYEYYSVDQIGRASYIESYGTMYPVIQGISYGSDLPNNTYLKITVRAKLNNAGDTVNVCDETSFLVAVDSEIPRLYSDSEGVYEGEDGRIYLSINVYDNNVLSNIWLYAYDEDGYTTTVDAPLPVDTALWVRGAKNNVVIDITDYMDYFTTTNIGVALEDASMNRAGYRLTIPASLLPEVSDGEDGNIVYAQSITYDVESNLAVYYSTDLHIVTYPANATYTLSILDMEDKTKYCGKAEIDSERKLVVAKEAGYVRVLIQSGDLSVEADIYIYVIDGEWVYQLITTGWITKFDPETGASSIDEEFIYSEETPDKKYYMIYAYMGEGSHVVIPSHYIDADGNSYEIAFIGQNAFAGCMNMYSVFIPNTIRGIGYAAFQYNYYLTDVIFEENSQLRSISSMAFEYDYALNNIEIPASVFMIYSRAFNDCTSLNNLTFEALTAAEGANLYSIQFGAFAGTEIEYLDLPETLHSFGSAFAGLPLKKIVIPENVTSGAVFTGCTQLEEVVLPSSTVSIASSAFSGCTSLRKINLPENITTIGGNAFYGCESLTNITIPDSVTQIGAGAFENCYRLVNVRFGNALSTLGNEAFANDISLRSVYFAEKTNITTWGTDVFYNCMNFTEYDVNPNSTEYMSDDGILYRILDIDTGECELYKVPQYKQVQMLLVRSDVSSIGDYAFEGHSELQTVFIPEGGMLNEIGDYAFTGCVNLSIINLENAVKLKTIGSYAFAYCTALTSVRLPKNLTSLSTAAFYFDLYLENITFNEKLNSIGGNAFGYCIRLKGTDGNGTLTLPASVGSLGSNCFVYNRELRKVDMGACTNLVGSNSSGYQFYNCYNLKEVILPAALRYVGEYMFYGCTVLEKINLEETATDTIRTWAFGYCESLHDVAFPDTLNTLYSYAFCGSGITSAVLPKNMGGQIMNYAFALCSNLTYVELPVSLSSLPSYVFAESGLTEIYIPNNYTSIHQGAFYNCYRLSRFIFDEDNPFYGATEEGIMYSITTQSYTDGSSETVYNLYILPPNLQIKELRLDERFTSIPSAFFRSATGIEKLYIPATVTSIGAGAFYNSKIVEIEFAADSEFTLTDDSSYSLFDSCTELERIILPRHLEYIPAYAFYGCTSLKSIDLPESVEAIGTQAFMGCTALESIDLSNVQEIYGYAFAYCSALKELNIGANMTYIDFASSETAFEGCTGLENISVATSNMKYKSIDGVLFDKTGTILYLYPAAKVGTEYTVPQGVTKINECAFAFNQNLERIILPKTLRTIGNAAFYQTENLHRYVFLGEEAPLLEGVYSSAYGAILYATFYDFYFEDFGDYYIDFVIPDGASGYDSWIYSYFIYETFSLTDEPAYEKPVYGEIPAVTETKPGEGEIEEAAFDTLFLGYINELKQDPDLDDATKAELDSLAERFNEDYDAFYEIITEISSFGEQFYNRYVDEANSIYWNRTELYAYRWHVIYELEDLLYDYLANYEYNEDYRKVLVELPYSIQYAVLNSSTVSDIEYYSNFYKNFIEGVPTLEEEEEFEAYCEEQAQIIETSYASIDATLYDEDAYAFLTAEYNTKVGAINSALTREQIREALLAWEDTLENTVKSADRAVFDAEKAAWIDRLHSYTEDDYEYSLWLIIQEYVERQIGYMEDTFIIDDIRAIAENAIEQIEMQTSKLDSRKELAKSTLNTVINSYAMYSNLFEEEASVLRAILQQVLEDIETAQTVEEVQVVANAGFDRIWAYYEYNQKAYTVYRQALEAFSELTGETYEEAMSALESVSCLVPDNYSAILELIAQYCGEDAANV